MSSTPANVYIGGSAFQQLQQSSTGLILVDVVAPHCASCETLKPVLHDLAAQHPDSLNLVQIDMSEDPDLAIELGVRSAPTVVFIKGGKLLTRMAGLKPKKQYLETVQQYL
ncbi:thioredoxin family protein [Anthocerotibacter panamensis]|uniref:thioredoxin family protein n=1 Tax=Anthocerotibacter panamensis TaxID=2857077 RepID=UPI001C404F54|nr:thioredoxin family protein [Anthocerotibacter panamensis]